MLILFSIKILFKILYFSWLDKNLFLKYLFKQNIYSISKSMPNTNSYSRFNEGDAHNFVSTLPSTS